MNQPLKANSAVLDSDIDLNDLAAVAFALQRRALYFGYSAKSDSSVDPQEAARLGDLFLFAADTVERLSLTPGRPP